jgi:hypothetical protein
LLIADELLAPLNLADGILWKSFENCDKTNGRRGCSSAANFWRHQYYTNFLVDATECSPLWQAMTAMRMEFAARVIDLLLQVRVHFPLLCPHLNTVYHTSTYYQESTSFNQYVERMAKLLDMENHATRVSYFLYFLLPELNEPQVSPRSGAQRRCIVNHVLSHCRGL